MKKTALILAAGQGTRMKSKTPKVLHKVCGKPMLSCVIDAAAGAGIEENIVVIGHGAVEVRERFAEAGVKFAVQEHQLGTGHAVMMAKDLLPEEGLVLVLCGDTPLITAGTLEKLIAYHERQGNTLTVLTARVEDPFGYGRIVRDDAGGLLKIVEEKDADEETKEIDEINSGMYCFEAGFLKNSLGKLTNDNAQQEYYITQLIEIALAEGAKAGAVAVKDADEIMGVNNRVQLADAEALMRRRINRRHMMEGVTFIDPAAAYIDFDVQIGRDTRIGPGVILRGKTVIGEDCEIGQNCRIEDSVIGNGVSIQSSTILESTVGDETTIGPCAYLRPHAHLGRKVKIGDFVEVKNASIGDGSKASHLAYIGDADVGREVNIGCGVVFVNYDGINKFRSVVEDDAFIGSNSNLIAPVHVEKQGYIAAGTTISRDVPEGSLVVGRPKERVIPTWGARKYNQKKEKKNAK